MNRKEKNNNLKKRKKEKKKRANKRFACSMLWNTFNNQTPSFQFCFCLPAFQAVTGIDNLAAQTSSFTPCNRT